MKIRSWIIGLWAFSLLSGCVDYSSKTSWPCRQKCKNQPNYGETQFCEKKCMHPEAIVDVYQKNEHISDRWWGAF